MKLEREIQNNGFLVPEGPAGGNKDDYRQLLTETIERDIPYTDLSKYRNF